MWKSRSRESAKCLCSRINQSDNRINQSYCCFGTIKQPNLELDPYLFKFQYISCFHCRLMILHASWKNRFQRSLTDQTSKKQNVKSMRDSEGQRFSRNTVDDNIMRYFSSHNLESEEHLRVTGDLLTLMNEDYHIEKGNDWHKPPVDNALPYQATKP